jgi:ribonuclease-3
MITEAEQERLAQLETLLQVTFSDKKLLKQALIHRSYINELKTRDWEHNERLEYLGDAVLEMVVSEYLYNNFPQYNEGELTSFRAATVRTTSLADTAQELNLGKFLYLSKGEEGTGGRTRPYILANTFEALLGAIYLDQGFTCARDFLIRVLLPKISIIIEQRLDIDNKSKLQEMSQELFGVTPNYELISAKGPDHAKEFTMSVHIGENVFGEGKGKNKQEAEENAASNAISSWEELSKRYRKA